MYSMNGKNPMHIKSHEPPGKEINDVVCQISCPWTRILDIYKKLQRIAVLFVKLYEYMKAGNINLKCFAKRCF